MQFPCPTCRQLLSAPDEAGGQKVQCPHCGQRLLLPAPPGSAAPNRTVLVNPEPPLVPAHAVQAFPSQQAPPWWRTRTGVALLVATAVAAAALVVVILLTFVRQGEPWRDPADGPVQRGSFRLTVGNYWISPGIVGNGPTRDDYFFLGVDMQNLGGSALPLPRWRHAQVTLRDEAGNACPLVLTPLLNLPRDVTVRPSQVGRRVIQFRAPRPGAEYLLLELSAGPLGGGRPVRWKIRMADVRRI